MEQVIIEIVEKLSSVGAEYSPAVIASALRAVSIKGFATIGTGLVAAMLACCYILWYVRVEWDHQSDARCCVAVAGIFISIILGLYAAFSVLTPSNWIAAFEPAGWLIMQTLTSK